LELYVTPDGDGLCHLCAVEVVICECDLGVQRRDMQPTDGGLICPGCAAIAVASITVLDARGRGRARGRTDGERRAA